MSQPDATPQTLAACRPRTGGCRLVDISNSSAGMGTDIMEHLAFDVLDSIPACVDVPSVDLAALAEARHWDPYSILGFHYEALAGIGVVRLTKVPRWQVSHVQMAFGSRPLSDGPMPCIRKTEWLEQLAIRVNVGDGIDKHHRETLARVVCENIRFLVSVDGGSRGLTESSFNNRLLLETKDMRAFRSGESSNAFDFLGANHSKLGNTEGIVFGVWAPNAASVSVIGEWNDWDPRMNPMRNRVEFGIWEAFVPDLSDGCKYKFWITARTGWTARKIDPFAREFERPPRDACIVSPSAESSRHRWTDAEWMRRQKDVNKLSGAPLSMYEVHLPSWRRGPNNQILNYRELAAPLATHINRTNFTHVQFLPLTHHPYDGSWGYQTAGYFAPYSALGNPDDLKYLINYLHRHNIGVILDFVPAHFCSDEWGLSCYDGEPLYEYGSRAEGEHEVWGTKIFNFSRHEVQSFLQSAIVFWIEMFHLDGIRIDAVSSMIYKNHCRQHWIPNKDGGPENWDAVRFLTRINALIHSRYPGVLTIAEESTAWPGITDRHHGLGFDLKWDLGWMNDTLSYLTTPDDKRGPVHEKLTFRGLYWLNERWVLPLSHDEVVSGKGSIVDKCGYLNLGFYERVQTLKILFGYQVTLPGRPLIFMGMEFGQGREWRCHQSIDWDELREDLRGMTYTWFCDVLRLYQEEPALHYPDEPSTFQWIDCDNRNGGIVAYLRKAPGAIEHLLLTVVNFSGVPHLGYPLGTASGNKWRVLLNSDDWKYGGQMLGPGRDVALYPMREKRFEWPYSLRVDVAARSCMVLRLAAPEQA